MDASLSNELPAEPFLRAFDARAQYDPARADPRPTPRELQERVALQDDWLHRRGYGRAFDLAQQAFLTEGTRARVNEVDVTPRRTALKRLRHPRVARKSSLCRPDPPSRGGLPGRP
jgi:hypothetical protein